jgi:SsrA-binding protein
MNQTQPQIENRKARHDYFIFDKYEAGISLLGSEVKSIREGKVNLADSFVRIVGDEAYLFNCHITPYSKIQGHIEIEPTRSRKLLLHYEEIQKLLGKTAQKGFAIVPLKMYFKKGRLKVEIALVKGKKEYDKREDIKRRIHTRESSAAIKNHQRKQR